MWVPVAVWQPCELLYTCYLLVTVGQWQVSVWKDKDLFPCGASGIHGTASFRSSASVWPTDSEDGPWMACTTALPQAAAYSSLYTDVWARHDGKKVCRQATNYDLTCLLPVCSHWQMFYSNLSTFSFILCMPKMAWDASDSVYVSTHYIAY